MIGLNEEEASMLVGTYATLLNYLLPALEGRARTDPRTYKLLQEATLKLEQAMDRTFRTDPKLLKMVMQKVLVLDWGQLAVSNARDLALEAFDEACPGTPHVRAFFEEALEKRLTAEVEEYERRKSGNAAGPAGIARPVPDVAET